MSLRTRLSRSILTAAGLVLLAAGCGDGSTGTPDVATLRTETPATSAAATAAGQRPVFPIDASDEDKKAMAKPWEDCLVKEGGPDYRGSGEVLVMKGGVIADNAESEAVFKSCEAQQPETYEDHQQRTNLTEFKDNQREWYQCAKDAGYALTPPDPETGQFGISEVGPNGDFGSPKMQECKRKAFAG